MNNRSVTYLYTTPSQNDVQKRFHKTHRQIKNPLSTFRKRQKYQSSSVVISLFLPRSPVESHHNGFKSIAVLY
jgi:hypothetical protein